MVENSDGESMKEEELDSLLAAYNLEIRNVALSKSITPSVASNFQKNWETIDEMEKIAMVGIMGKFMDLEKLLDDYAKDKPQSELITVLASFLGDVYGHFQTFYRYNLYMDYEKKARKDLQRVKNSINEVTHRVSDYERQIEEVYEQNLVADFLTAERDYKYLKKGFAFERKRIDASVRKYEFTDYIFLLDTEIEKLEKILSDYELPHKLEEIIRSWYQRLNEVMEKSIYTINEYRGKYQNYCQKYGVGVKTKDTKENLVSLLQLFNPNVGIVYDGKELYISDITKLNLPNGYSLDKENGLLTGYDLNKTVSIKVVYEYNYTNVMSKFRALNPESKLYISKVSGKYTVTTNEDIETLKMPVGFYYVKNPQTGEVTITNKTKGDIKAIKLGYRQVTRGAKKVSKMEEAPKVEVERPKEIKVEASVKKEEPEFSQEKKKVVKHLKQETKKRDYRKFKGLLKFSSHLPIVGAASLVGGGAIVSQGFAKVLSGLAKLGDIMASKMHHISQKLGTHEKAKLQASIAEIKSYKKDCEKTATAMASEVKKAVTPKVKPVVEEVPTFNLEDILEEFRGR